MNTIYGYLIKILVFILTFLSPFSTLIYSLIFLIIVDLITAIFLKAKAKKGVINKIKVIESHKLRKSVVKFVLYILFLTSVYVCVNAIFPGTIITDWTMKFTFFSLASVELVSISENLNKIIDDTIFTKIVRKIIKTVLEKIMKLFD